MHNVLKIHYREIHDVCEIILKKLIRQGLYVNITIENIRYNGVGRDPWLELRG